MSSTLTARYQHKESKPVVTRVRRGHGKEKDEISLNLEYRRRGERDLLKSGALLHPTSGNFKIALDKSVKPSVNHNFVESLNNRTHSINDGKINQLRQLSTQVRLSTIVNRIFLFLTITNYK